MKMPNGAVKKCQATDNCLINASLENNPDQWKENTYTKNIP